MHTISIIGVGRLGGLCLALNLEQAGYHVMGMDINNDYIKSLADLTFLSQEPGVNEYLYEAKNLKLTTDLCEAANFSDIIFIFANTPSRPNGEYNCGQIDNIVKCLNNISSRKKLVICSTVMPGYCDSIVTHHDIIYNPEFIAIGTILRDQAYPEIIVIGEEGNSADDICDIYNNLCKSNFKLCRMPRLSAEVAKISLNCAVIVKISLANLLGDICNTMKIDPADILQAVGADSRIGHRCFKDGYGQPRFLRDNHAMVFLCKTIGIAPTIFEAIDKFDKEHLQNQLVLLKKGSILPENVCFSDGTYEITSIGHKEESQQLLFAVNLAKTGAKVIIKDSQVVIEEVKSKYGELFVYEIK